MKCKQCGAEYPDWLDFCPECLAPANADVTETPESEQQEAAAPEAQDNPVSEPEQAPAPEAAKPAEAQPEEKKASRRKKREPEAEVYQSPERPRKSRRRKNARRGASPFLWFLSGFLFSIAALAALMLAGVVNIGRSHPAPDGQQIVAEQGYDTPEDVMKAYAGALGSGDLTGMLSTYAASAYYTHVPTDADYNTDFENNSAFMIWSVSQAELQAAGTELSEAVAAEETRSYLLDTIMTQFTYPLYHTSPYYTYDEDNGLALIRVGNADELQDFLASLPTVKPFSEVKLGEVFEVSDRLSKEAAEDYHATMEHVAENCRAEAAAFYCIELTIDGEDYVLGMELVQYDGKWYNNAPYDYGVVLKDEFANNSFGGLIPVAAIESWK